MARPPQRTDTVAAIGAYLDLVPGKEVNPGVVTNWVNKFREYVPTVCDTPKINLIFGLDATVGPYPVFAEPLLPAADCTRFEAKIWETFSIYPYSIFSTSKLLASGPAALGASFERSQSGTFGSFLSLRFLFVEHRRLFVHSRSVSDLEIVEHRRLLFDFSIVDTTVFSVANSSSQSTKIDNRKFRPVEN